MKDNGKAHFKRPEGGKADFKNWLGEKILTSGKSHRLLTIEMGLHRTAFTQWLKHNQIPTPESCQKLATYFNEDPNKILSLAGYFYLVSAERDTPVREQLTNLLRGTPDRLIPELLRISRAYVQMYRKESEDGPGNQLTIQ